ncbi:MAG: type II toxin-antitoxin system VapC family toxin [bacterium]|nr:type II toxin-antitoxin system VapC family toxin [bacterium]
MMNNAYLLDTDICIHFLQGAYKLVQKIAAIEKDNCYISEITIAELLFGAENSDNPEKHRSEIGVIESHFKIVPIYPVLSTYAREKARLRTQGTPLPDFDILIGATGLFHGMTVVTGNTKHLKRIEELSIENWTIAQNNEYLR